MILLQQQQRSQEQTIFEAWSIDRVATVVAGVVVDRLETQACDIQQKSEIYRSLDDKQQKTSRYDLPIRTTANGNERMDDYRLKAVEIWKVDWFDLLAIGERGGSVEDGLRAHGFVQAKWESAFLRGPLQAPMRMNKH